MIARDVMTSPVVTTTPTAAIVEIVELMLKHHVSALPVLDDDGQLVGIVSEGDLIQRDEIGTLPHRSWWLSALGTKAQLAEEFVKSHGATAESVMTPTVLTAHANTPLHEIAETLERKKVKRLPIMEEGKLVGVVSRANLLQALVVQRSAAQNPPSAEDKDLRTKLLAILKGEPWADTSHLNIIVRDSVVYLWGSVKTEAARNALVVAAREIPGVTDVVDHTDRTVMLY